jgi:hypothetical protein
MNETFLGALAGAFFGIASVAIGGVEGFVACAAIYSGTYCLMLKGRR